MWANEIRERRPSREELAALVDATCLGLPADQRTLLIDGLRAFVASPRPEPFHGTGFGPGRFRA